VPTNLAYLLSGCANGHPLSIGGGGTIDGGRLRLEVRAETAPLDFDPVIAALACVDPLLAVAAGVVAVREGEPIVFRCRADFLTEGGAEVGTVAARGAIERDRDGLAFRAQLADARLTHEVGETVVAVPDHELVTAGHCLLSERRLDTSRGRETFLMAATRIYGDPPAPLRAVPVRACRVSRASGSSGVILGLDLGFARPEAP